MGSAHKKLQDNQKSNRNYLFEHNHRLDYIKDQTTKLIYKNNTWKNDMIESIKELKKKRLQYEELQIELMEVKSGQHNP